jgi:hypothetical protein
MANLLNVNLPNGFSLGPGGSNYGVFNSWVRLDGHYGFYSGTNSAHIYPNNGTHGSWRIEGSRNSYNGFEFSATNGSISLMINNGSNTTGLYNNSYGWQILWENGTLYCYKNTYGGGTQATVLDSVNAIYAWNMNQYVRTTDSVRFNSLGVNVAASATAGRIDAGNDIVAFSSSDERLKKNIVPIQNALEKVMSLTGVEFDWKPEHKDAHGYEGHDTGIIAQQVQNVIPSAVRTNQTGFLAVRYEKLIGLLIEGMKEQQSQIDELRSKLK